MTCAVLVASIQTHTADWCRRSHRFWSESPGVRATRLLRWLRRQRQRSRLCFVAFEEVSDPLGLAFKGATAVAGVYRALKRRVRFRQQQGIVCLSYRTAKVDLENPALVPSTADKAEEHQQTTSNGRLPTRVACSKAAGPLSAMSTGRCGMAFATAWKTSGISAEATCRSVAGPLQQRPRLAASGRMSVT